MELRGQWRPGFNPQQQNGEEEGRQKRQLYNYNHIIFSPEDKKKDFFSSE